MGKPWNLGKEEKAEEAWPSVWVKNSQGAQKETGPRYLGAATTKEGDPWEVQERISQELDN